MAMDEVGRFIDKAGIGSMVEAMTRRVDELFDDADVQLDLEHTAIRGDFLKFEVHVPDRGEAEDARSEFWSWWRHEFPTTQLNQVVVKVVEA